MARSTPKYTPVRNYAIGFFLSASLLYSDISYGTFAPLRGFFHASALYGQMVSISFFQEITNTFSSIQNNSSLLKENKNLKEEILKIRTLDFINSLQNEAVIQTNNFQEDLMASVDTQNINLLELASIDLRNYLCCSTHRVFLKTTNSAQVGKNIPVFAGKSYIGQTKDTSMNLIEVILLSDSTHVLPIKSKLFYCDARGTGKPMLISCKLNSNHNDSKNQIGDLIFTSGLGGVFLKDIEIGFISAIKPFSFDEIEIVITLKTNPLEETIYGIVRKEQDES